MKENPSMKVTGLQVSRDGIAVLSIEEHHYGLIAGVIYTGEVLPVATVSDVMENVDGQPTNKAKGSLYDVTVPSLDYAQLYIRLPNTKTMITQTVIDTQGVTATFRCGDCMGLFLCSYDNQLLGYTTDLSEIEVVGLFE